MGIRDYAKATRPTFYFIGVTTGKSSIMKVFPEWAKFLGLPDVVIKGIDFKPHDEPDAYAAGETYLPEALTGRRYYQPVDRGLEIKIAEKLAMLRRMDEEASKKG